MNKNRTLLAKNITLHSISAKATKGFLKVGHIHIPCSIGKNGRKVNKIEGDGASPIGSFTLKEIFFRTDKTKRPATYLNTTAIKKDDLWCDDPKSALYNRKVKSPFGMSAEKLYRDDCQYDLVVVLNHNTEPVIKYKGSAIFIHITKNSTYPPTEGCLAFKKSDLLKILRHIGRTTRIHI